MNTSPKLLLLVPVVAVAIALMAPNAHATPTPVTFTGSSGNLSASVSFSVSGTGLTVVLTNTSTADVLVPADVLTAVFFDIAQSTTLTPVSATVTSGSIMINGIAPGNVVGGEWAYKAGLSGTPGNATRGISSSGIGNIFGPPDRFPGNNLSGPVSPDGLQYGITSVSDNTSTGNSKVTSTALTKNSVTFVLSFTGGYAALDFSNVRFQYGTSLSEPSYSGNPPPPPPPPPVPEPISLISLSLGLVGLGILRKRRI